VRLYKKNIEKVGNPYKGLEEGEEKYWIIFFMHSFMRQFVWIYWEKVRGVFPARWH